MYCTHWRDKHQGRLHSIPCGQTCPWTQKAFALEVHLCVCGGGGVQIQKRCMPGPWCMLVPKDMNVYSASVMLACCRMVMPLKQRSSSAHYVTRGWPHPRVAVIIHCHIYYNSKRWCLGEEGSTQCSRNIHKALIHPRVPFICHQRDLNSRLFITAASPPPNPHVKK